MTQETRDPSTFPPIAASQTPESRSSPDLEETVAILECSDRPSAQGYRDLSSFLNRSAGSRSALFLVLRNLERIDGSLTGFVLGLESILRSTARPILLGDPSGVASLVLASSERDRRLRIVPALGAPGSILVVNPSPAAGAILCAVMEAYGRRCTLVESGIEARAELAAGVFDVVLLDLDLPGLQAYGVAELLKSRPSPPVQVAVTGNDEVWYPENSRRYGFRRILSKPYSVAELVGLASGC